MNLFFFKKTLKERCQCKSTHFSAKVTKTKDLLLPPTQKGLVSFCKKMKKKREQKNEPKKQNRK